MNDEIGYSSEVIDLEVQIKATLSSIYDVKVDTIVSILNETQALNSTESNQTESEVPSEETEYWATNFAQLFSFY